jgi:beta-lactamase class D
MRIVSLLIVSACVFSSSAHAGLLEHFSGYYGALEIYDEKAKLSFRVNPAALTQPTAACSLKMLDQALVALSQKQIAPKRRMTWDKLRFPAQAGWSLGWQRDQHMAHALKRQTPWFFESLNLGPGKSALTARDAAPKVSPLTVVDWFKALRKSALPYPAEAQRALVDALARQDASKSYRRVSFGTQCELADKLVQSWNVGFVDHPGGTVYFAVLVEAKTRDAIRFKAPEIRDKALVEMQFWPKPESSLP